MNPPQPYRSSDAADVAGRMDRRLGFEIYDDVLTARRDVHSS